MKIIYIFTLLFLSACAAGMTDRTMPVDTELQAKMYNSVASQYMNRPTFVDLNIQKSGDKVLDIQVVDYLDNKVHLMVFYRDMHVYLNAIDKYLEWEEKAKVKRHVFDKVIDTYSSPWGIDYSFNFHSGNKYTHYLSIGMASNMAVIRDYAGVFVFDRENALILRKLIMNGYTTDVLDISGQYQ